MACKQGSSRNPELVEIACLARMLRREQQGHCRGQ
jgi:hypothetical protein